MLSSGLLVIHDSGGGGKDEVSELTGWKKSVGVLLQVVKTDVESWRDDGGLVETSGEVDDDLSGAVVVDDLELSDVSVLHHDGQEADDDLEEFIENLKRGMRGATRIQTDELVTFKVHIPGRFRCENLTKGVSVQV
ncbi:hypothetical protein GCK72_011595 [Caenorhabditis remanei]|uniref:Uncharacterized protein n=1 Tax=Caenorhabditis remanei TaxID=31234 RepID=A0A6A5H8D4_CAERE|nr:hypothetical protein GCK72_011595 [Caenorhabditis remanei]KAF1763329.1 hypothetical protein GCK72_011595 [Caenorhabditis remanei]